MVNFAQLHKENYKTCAKYNKILTVIHIKRKCIKEAFSRLLAVKFSYKIV